MWREVPEGWTIKRLGEICRPRQWPTIPKASFTDEGYPVYGANGPIGKYHSFTHQGEVIAVTCRGATCGAVNLVPPFSYVTGNAMALDDVDQRVVQLRYLYQLLKHVGFDNVVSGSAQPQITGQSISIVALCLPPLAEQRRIAEILSSVDEAIAATRAVIEQTRKVKQGALERLLTKGIGHSRFKQTEIGEIPEGWEVVEVQEHFHVQLGKMLSKAARVGKSPSPYLRNANVQWGHIDTSDLLHMDFSEEERQKFRLQRGDLLVCEGGEVGRCAIWDGSEEMYYQKALHRLREKTGMVSNQFLMYVLVRIFTSKALSSGLVGTNSIAHFTREQFLRLKLPMPKSHEQNAICSALVALDGSCKVNSEKQQALLNLKSALMSDLLTGRKRVTGALPIAAE